MSSNASTQKQKFDIKSMHLYDQGRLDFPLKELLAKGIDLKKDGATVAPSALYPYLMLNYTAYVDYGRLAKGLGLDESSKLFDLGSGLGGPAMKLAHEAKCEVVGLELQKDVCECANFLAHKCELYPRVQFLPGDIMDDSHALNEGANARLFDGMLSLLCILHIPANVRGPLFKKCRSLLKEDAALYIEDFFIQSDDEGTPCELSAKEAQLLTNEVAVPDGKLPTQGLYLQQLKEAGFGEVEFHDVTDEWTQFTTERHNSWVAMKTRHVEVHGLETWSNLDIFYGAVRELFQGGKLRGCRIKSARG